jgi:glycolate oxidase FAD binding subunit
MTITVGAGMEVGVLQTLLATENQQLPIDVPDDRMTLGQMVADDISGPRQFGYGTLRDYVIGIEAIDGRGRVFHAGGRVVKNVAGYDLCRLLVGSRGELGTISQLTFKLKPLATRQTLVIAGFRSWRDIETALERLNLTATTPVILDVIGRYASPTLLKSVVPDLAGTTRCSDAVSLLVLGFEGPEVSCQWQAGMLKDELQGTAAWTHLCDDRHAFPSYCRAAQQAAVPASSDLWMARLSTLPSRVVSAMTVLQECGCDVFGRAGNGVLNVRSSTNTMAEAKSVDESASLGHLQSLVSEGVGSVLMLKSSQGKSTSSSPEVQAISRKLRELLGTSGAMQTSHP